MPSCQRPIPRASLAPCLALACALVACGSKRLETAFEPLSGDAGAGGDPAPLVTEPLVTLADFGASYVVGPINAERFQLSGQAFTDAWRATMSEPPSSPWVAQLVVPLDKAVGAGRLLHVSFWLSCEAPGPNGDCYTEYIFERASDPWEKSVTFAARAAQPWSQKSEYFSTVSGYEAGGAHMVFRLGYEDQVIAIGGLLLEAIEQSP